MEKRIDRDYWNIVKGIGIVLVVVGHCCIGNVSRYVYLFHLPLFFFVSGYFYDEEKYGDKPYLNIANRIKSSWSKYVLISWILIIFHNFFYNINLIGPGTGLYSKIDVLNEMCKAALGISAEAMGATLWFVPVLVFSVSILGVIVTISRKLYEFTKNIGIKYLFQFVAISAFAIIGYVVEQRADLVAQMQIAWLVMPFVWAGYLLRNLKIEFEKYLCFIVAILSAVIIYYAHLKYYLDLALNIIYPLMFVIAFLGIYMCLYVAKIFNRYNTIRHVFGSLGKISFAIMFIHFPIFRIFDWLYIKIMHNSNLDLYYSSGPIVFRELWLVYLLLGIAIPLLVYWILSKCIELIQKKRR